MFKLIDSHLSMNNRFSSINAYSKSTFEDFRGVSSAGTADIRSTSKQQQVRQQQQPIDQQRRITYRSSDYAWNDHPSSRADNLSKTKLSSPTRHFTNGASHENIATSMPHLSTTPTGHQQHVKDGINNGDVHASSGPKSRPITRNQRTSINLEKTSGSNGFNLSTRGGSYHSTRLDQSTYPRQTTAKQRNHVSSKSSFHETNVADLHLNGLQDENTYYFHQQPNGMSSTQRLNGSTFDISASRKPFLINKSNTFNVPTNGTGHHGNYNSAQELHRSDTAVDKTNLARFAVRGATASKERLITTPKHRQTLNVPTGGIPTIGNLPDERQRSAQSYKSRDANVSYAYTNVKKYMEENDLMTPEKEHSIRQWIVDVDKYRHDFQKIE